MKRFIFLMLLAFTAHADNTIELTGDLNLTGTNETVDTVINYDLEGNAVQLCIGLTLNSTNTGGGGGGVNQGLNDLGTSIVLSGENNQIATNPGTNSLAEYVASVTGHSTGYHKFEIEYLVKPSSGASQVAWGLAQGTPDMGWIGQKTPTWAWWEGGNVGTFYKDGVITIASDGNNKTLVGWTQSWYVRDGQHVWVEIHNLVDGTSLIVGGGDPETNTTPTLSFDSAGELFAGITPYGRSTSPASIEFKSTAAEFNYPTRGATPWDD